MRGDEESEEGGREEEEDEEISGGRSEGGEEEEGGRDDEGSGSGRYLEEERESGRGHEQRQVSGGERKDREERSESGDDDEETSSREKDDEASYHRIEINDCDNTGPYSLDGRCDDSDGIHQENVVTDSETAEMDNLGNERNDTKVSKGRSVPPLDIYSLLDLSEGEISQVEGGSSSVRSSTDVSQRSRSRSIPLRRPSEPQMVTKQHSEGHIAVSSSIRSAVCYPTRTGSKDYDSDGSMSSIESSDDEQVEDNNENNSDANNEEMEIISMRNARYIDAHKKRMELAAEKRKPKVRELGQASRGYTSPVNRSVNQDAPRDGIGQMSKGDNKDVIYMRNAKYIDAHKKRMEVAAEKRKPKVKKLPPAVDYKSIISKNKKLQGNQSSARDEDVKKFNNTAVSPKSSALVHRHVPKMQRRVQDHDDMHRSTAQNARNKIVNKMSPSYSQSTTPRDTYCGEIQVKDREQDEKNKFEMLVLVHDDKNEKDNYINAYDANMFDHSHHEDFGDDLGREDRDYLDTLHQTVMDKQYQMLRDAQKRGERIIAELNTPSSGNDDNRNIYLELEALDTIQNTLTTALDVCDHSLKRVNTRSINTNVKPLTSLRKHQLPTLVQEDSEDEENDSERNMQLNHLKQLEEERQQLLLQWKDEEQKRVLKAQTDAIEKELKHKVEMKERELVRMKLEKKRTEQMAIVEELKKIELERQENEKERRIIAQEISERKKDRMERKAMNQRINDFLEAQEAVLQNLKAKKQHGPSKLLHGGVVDDGSTFPRVALDPVPEEDFEDEPSPIGRIAPGDMANNARAGLKDKSFKLSNQIGHRAGGNESDRRRERNEYYRAKNEEKERLKQMELMEIQERLNPSAFRAVKGNVSKKYSNLGRAGKKKVKPAVDYSGMLSRNRKVQ